MLKNILRLYNDDGHASVSFEKINGDIYIHNDLASYESTKLTQRETDDLINFLINKEDD